MSYTIMAEGTVSARIGIEREKKAKELIEKGYYESISQIIIEALDEKLDPEKAAEKRLNKILYDLKNNPEIREEIKRLFTESQA
jgi:Arc/MetJ-type ribon-helix-helix transcriptional regulator